jgi:hypothetical protein
MHHLTIPQAIKLARNSQAVVDIQHHSPELALREIMEYWPNVDWLEIPDGIVSVLGHSSQELNERPAWEMLIRPQD